MEFFEDEKTNSTSTTYSYAKGSAVEKKKFIVKAYLYMAGGLMLSFILAFLEGQFCSNYFRGPISLVLAVAELLVALVFSLTFQKMSKTMAFLMYFLYAGLTGLSLGSVFIYFNVTTVYLCFIITSVLFIAMALFGHFTSWDMSGWGTYLLSGLIGIIVMTLIGTLFHFTWLIIFVSCIAIALFMGLTAYDAKKLSSLFDVSYGQEGGLTEKMCLLGAFQLYLDFINLFLYILKLLSIIQNDN